MAPDPVGHEAGIGLAVPETRETLSIPSSFHITQHARSAILLETSSTMHRRIE